MLNDEFAIGICDQLVAAMLQEKYSEPDAKQKLWLVDSKGLVHTGRPNLENSKRRYAQPSERVGLIDPAGFSFFDVLKSVQPTILIGTSWSAWGFQ